MSDTPSTSSRQQQESARYRSAISESLLQSIQGNINYLLTAVSPLGSVVHSLLTEAQFQAIVGTGWVLCDGRNVSTSAFATLTGQTSLPDARGRFLRGKDHGTAVNLDGNLALGAVQTDANKSHNHGGITGTDTPDHSHSTAARGDNGSDYAKLAASNPSGSSGTVTTAGRNQLHSHSISSEGSESRPKNVTVNIFIRID